MSEQLVEKGQRRRRGSFSRPEQIAAQETLHEKLKAAGMDSPDAPKSLLEEGEAIIRQAGQLLPSDESLQAENVATERRALSDTIVADRPRLFAHSKTKSIDAEQVVKLAAIGCTNSEIAVQFGVHESTISRRFAGSLQKGRALRKQLLRQRQTQVALQGNVGMLIWLGKNELGQRNIPLEISDPYARPLSINFFDAILEEKKRRKLGGKQGEV